MANLATERDILTIPRVAQRRAVRNSFATPEVKAALLADLDAWAVAG